MATYQDKLLRIIQKITERTGLINIVPGTKAYDIAQAVASELMEIEKKIEDDNKKNSIAFAEGEDLNKIGEEFFGVTRRRSVSLPISDSMGAIKFYVRSGTFGNINNGENILVPEGTIIESTINGVLVKLRTTYDTILENNISEKYFSAELISGSIDSIPSNSLTKHNFINYANNLSNLLLVTNPISITVFTPEESDNNYRYRIKEAQKAFVKTNIAGIHDLVTGYPGVSYAIIDPSSNGGGTFSVYIQGTTPITTDELIQDIEILLSENIGPWIQYDVVKPNYLGLQMEIKIITKDPTKYNSDEGFIENIKEIISIYVNNFFGKEIYLLEILKEIENLSDDILDVEFVSLKLYNGIGRTRSYTELETENPKIYLSDIEKLIIEPISNPITVQVE